MILIAESGGTVVKSQGHLGNAGLMQITATIFATMVAATLLIPQQTAPPLPEKYLSAGMRHQDLPPIIHIVLDEFIGVEGIPTDIDGGKDLKEELKSFYLDKGFHVFGKAFSSFYHTHDSMSHLLNPSESYARGLTKPGGKRVDYELIRSEYFSRLEERGYIFNINQLSHSNYCNAVKTRLAKCRTARANTAKLLQNLPVSWPGKFRVLARLYFSQSLIWRAIRAMYRRISAMISSAWLPLPIWQWERPLAGPLSAFESVDFPEKDLRTASRGEYHFAHMLTPHSPHVYDRNCEVDEPSEWTWRRIPEGLSKLSNTPEIRRHRYKRYFEQVRCLQKRIAGLLAFIDRSSDLKDAVLILHGDHGSRITLWEPRSSNKERLVQSDYVDGYSTLFAIRGPGLPAGYDMRLISIQGLFGYFMENGFTSLPGTAYHTGEPTILLHGGAGRDIVPMVDFGDTGVGGG